VPGDVTLWPNLSGGEVIDLFGRPRGGLTTKLLLDEPTTGLDPAGAGVAPAPRCWITVAGTAVLMTAGEESEFRWTPPSSRSGTGLEGG
jgi:hypothetical protein